MKTRSLFAALGCLSLGTVGCSSEAPPAQSWEVGSGLRLDDDSVVSVAYGSGPGTVVEGNDPRLADARAPLPGNGSYIQNGTQAQDASLSLSGVATAKSGLFVDAAAGVGAPVPLLRVVNTSTGTPVWDALPLFTVDSGGGLLARGELGYGKVPMSGAGMRLMWSPFRSAFRAGYADDEWNEANLGFYSWAGGVKTRASGFAGFAFGDGCLSSGTGAVCFGSQNQSTGSVSFASGANSIASGFGSVAMGYTNTATGQGSIAVGYRVTADADYSTALGQRASSGGFSGSFIWGDQSTTAFVSNTGANQFMVRAAGGVFLRTNATLTTGCNLPAGSGVFSCTSDRHQKEDFRRIDGEQLLAKVARLPVESWRYKEEASGVRHLGPVAQDFRAAFGLGVDDTSIGMLDIDGVNMAAIQALERRTRELHVRDAEVDALKAELAELKRGVAELKAAMSRDR
ncbi:MULTISPECIES: tail fiber domain-containing protein [unclassified Myxococcus]|uniref:tail fiber domain-containing protein n=1 Tax=unclassified Myxococcus TaxID=2648731 RepID=UPI00157AF6B2|nr:MULTISPECIES: tail fiber domain-containing protein [unclassified Myxococcus]NTX07799.1 tail fiber domain-containing protein [Myxococcus sp. CA040A]NTX52470.1 tail fiber domain-containing protein [Myxococcus sp. CA039A]